jgi:putative DNA-invertase from lambdoid prophage Rac
MTVYAYARVSTIDQAEDGESLGVQERQIAGYAQMLGVEVDRVFVERGVSGAKPLADRPEGAKLLAAIKPGDVVIATKLDRLFRSALDALQVGEALKAGGVHLHLLDLGGDITNGMSKVFFTIAAAFAEAERDRIRERIQDVKRDQRERGRYLGGAAPFGYAVAPGGELVEDPAQQAAINEMRAMRGAGLSLRKIAAEMAARGIKISHVGVAAALGEGRPAAA